MDALIILIAGTGVLLALALVIGVASAVGRGEPRRSRRSVHAGSTAIGVDLGGPAADGRSDGDDCDPARSGDSGSGDSGGSGSGDSGSGSGGFWSGFWSGGDSGGGWSGDGGGGWGGGGGGDGGGGGGGGGGGC